MPASPRSIVCITSEVDGAMNFRSRRRIGADKRPRVRKYLCLKAEFAASCALTQVVARVDE